MPLIQANGTALFYDLTGPADAPVLAFSNSLGTTSAMWDPLVSSLGAGWRVLRYDTRGHGRSAVVEPPFGIGDLADDLAGLLDGLGIASAHVVGLSLGGLTAQSFALRHPGRAISLTLMATAAHLPPPSGWRERAALVRRDGMGPAADTAGQRWFTDAFQSDPHAQALIAGLRGIDPAGYAAACEALAGADLRDAICGISTPTLILAGADDPVTPPAAAEELRARIPDAELIVLPRASHLLAVERPEAAARHLRTFLARFGGFRRPGASFEEGLANRNAVLGAEHVARSLAGAGAFAMPWQEFITRTAWGEIWGDPSLPWKTRSMLTLTMMVALHREEEFKLHVRPALRNGVTLDEMRALLIQCAVYAGVPAVNAGFRWVKEVLGEELDR